MVIRHVPQGRGHAYRPSLDQRVPFIPQVDDGVEFRALASPEHRSLEIDIEIDGAVSVLTMAPIVESGGVEGPATEDVDAHLAAAAAAGEDTDGLLPWSVRAGPFESNALVRYRFRCPEDQAVTDWWSFATSRWQPDGGRLVVAGPAQDRLVADSVRWLTATADPSQAPSRVRLALRLAPEEHVVGLGERFHSLDQRGWQVDTVVFEQYRDQGTRTYLPVPFAIVVGGTGWGFQVDTTRRCWFDVGATRDDELIIEIALDPTRADPVQLHTWNGPPEQVLDGFLEHVGRPTTVPSWVYRPWMSGNEWNRQDRIEREVQRSLDEDIPLGAIVIEAWSDEGTFVAFNDAAFDPVDGDDRLHLSDFTFPPDGAWPDPHGMVEKLHAADVRVLLWQIPLIPDHADTPQMVNDRALLRERGWAVSEEDGKAYRNRGWWFPKAILPDFTRSEVRTWWTERRRYLLEELGIDGFKTDGGEHAWGDELRYGDGSRGDEGNNRFANLYAQAFHELFQRTGSDAVTFSRAGFTGAGSFPCHWAGDEASTWEAFRASITAGLTAGASGIFLWGWDLAGFSGEIPDPELYLRSAAMACFCPIMQLHSEFNHHRQPSRDRTPWNIAERHERPDVLSTYRRFGHLRERLVPYLASQTETGIAGGRPLMRALCFAWPDDPEIWQYPFQYLLGDDLLVSPVTEPAAASWQVYVPGGRWVDPWEGGIVTGPTTMTMPTPIDRIPVLIRESAAAELVPLFSGLPD